MDGIHSGNAGVWKTATSKPRELYSWTYLSSVRGCAQSHDSRTTSGNGCSKETSAAADVLVEQGLKDLCQVRVPYLKLADMMPLLGTRWLSIRRMTSIKC